MALEIAVLTGVTQADGTTLLAGTVYAITSNSAFAEAIADFLGIRAEYNARLSGFGIMEIPTPRLLSLTIDRQKNEIDGVNLRQLNYSTWNGDEYEKWDVCELADAQTAARAPGARIMIKG